jgi:Cd2+/Zn2+-exporting ATPase
MPEHAHDHDHDHDHPHDHDHQGQEKGHGHSHGDWRLGLILAGVCAVLAVTGLLLERAGLWALPAYLGAYLAGAWQPAGEAFRMIRRRQLDVHFLMLAVAVGAAVIGHWWEGAFLLFLFSGSGALEALAEERTERELTSLFKAAPKHANVILPDGTEQQRPVEELSVDTLIRVRPGEAFPADAEVLTGTSAADESSLTGESLPVDKAPGAKVFSGTLNLWGALECRVTRHAAESSLARIILLIQEAQESKAPSQRFTDRFGSIYTWCVLAATLAGFLIWWLVLKIPPFADAPETGRSALYRAMTLLVVASPCALVLSIPSAILAGIAAGAKRGILFRGGSAVERLAEINRVALDKTGTITTGDLKVDTTIAEAPNQPGDAKELLRLAAALSRQSNHPVSRAIAAAASYSEQPRTREFRSLAGLGLEGVLEDGRAVRLGRRSLFPWAADLSDPPLGMTETLVEAGPLRGRVLLRDTIRPEAKGLLERLHALGLKVTMLTGDRPEAANLVAKEIGLVELRAGLKPEEKVAAIQDWEAAGQRTAMVGDGVNDAPSLAAAHVAVGMGLRGSDAVLEQADVVLTQDKLERFITAYLLSRRARAIIRQNLVISLGIITVLLLGAMGSRLPLALGVLGHEGSTVIVVINSLRLLFYRDPA